MAKTIKLNLAGKKPASDTEIPKDPIEGLVKALEAITDEMALQSELLCEIAYKQGAISEKRYKEILEDE